MLTHLSLFTGIGGLDIAAEWAGFTTVGQCEWADYPTKVLEKHWPEAPRWRDIREVTSNSFFDKTGLRSVAVISGGFPCQPFSVAGKRKGRDDDRYLWPEMLRVISEIRPAWVVGENVANLVNMVEFETVCTELEAEGYEVQPFIIPAAGIGANHLRKRVFIVGHSNGHYETKIREFQERQNYEPGRVCSNVAHPGCSECERRLEAAERSQGETWDQLTSCGVSVADTYRAGCKELNATDQPTDERYGSGGGAENIYNPYSRRCDRQLRGGVCAQVYGRMLVGS